MGAASMATVGKLLCALCDEFTRKLTAGVQKGAYDWPSGSDGERFRTAAWHDGMTIWSGTFKHHTSLADLISSAKGCDLCRVLEEDFKRLTSSTTTEEYYKGWLGLYFHGRAAYTAISGGLRTSGEVFRAGFSESLAMMPPREAPNNNPPLMYRVCTHDEATPPLRTPSIERRTARRIPESGTSPAVFDVANTWLAQCMEHHAQCRERPPAQPDTGDGPLPTRVVDVDPTLKDKVRLLVSGGKKAPYVALSHCWGGNIPNKTIQSTLDTMQQGISISSLPQNFQDAIFITRRLGIRYVWIDALCIVQDDPADWVREADLMDEVYAYSTVTITGLDSPSSTAGILRPQRSKSVVIPKTPQYAIQACADSLPVAMGRCVLSERAWCLQERFLAARLLHFGSAQILWECRVAMAAEDDRPWDWEGSALAVRNLVNLHRELGKSQPSSEHWCLLVEEYSMRRLTFGTDKLPAMTGISQMFKAKNPQLGKYVAGIWSGDIAKELCWGPSLVQFKEDRKRPGYAGNDQVAMFTRPEKQRAPSWSWASVDGSLYFPCSRRFLKPWASEIEVVDITMDEKSCRGTLTLRGRVGVFDYHEPRPPQSGVAAGDAGLLKKQGDEAVSGGICVLDFDRHKPKMGCFALLVASSDTPRAFACFLVLEKTTDGNFKRIGMSTCFFPPFMREPFEKTVQGLEVRQLSIE